MIKEILLKYLAPEIDSIVRHRLQEALIKQQEEKLLCNYPVGRKVIIRSNEPGPLMIATVSGHIRITQAQELVCTFKEEGTGKETIFFGGNPMYWCQEREDALNKLTWDEQYNVSTKYHWLKKEECERKNSPEYLK